MELSNVNTGIQKPVTNPTRAFFESTDIKARFNELMGKRAPQFIASVLQSVANNKLLANADPKSVYMAAVTAATLNLPINQNLGFAYIVPYKGEAQFQIGWKGLVQLAQRTGQYQRINVIAVYENQFKAYNALTEELQADFTVDGKGRIVGYAAYFKLNNGFEKLSFWSREKVEQHGRRYSKSFSNGVWNTDFDAMALKTVLKNTLAKWGILSIEMEEVIIKDQSVEDFNGNLRYIDNEADTIDKEAERERLLIQDCKTLEDIELLCAANPNLDKALIDERKAQIADGN